MNGRAICVLFFVLVVSGAACGRKPGYQGKSVAELERMVRDPDPAMQVQGAYGLGLQGAEARVAVDALIDALKSEHLPVRQHAAMALGQICAWRDSPDPAARPVVAALTEALRDSEWTVRRHAAIALGQIGPDARAAMPQLQKLAQDPDHLVRNAAQDALKKIGLTPNP